MPRFERTDHAGRGSRVGRRRFVQTLGGAGILGATGGLTRGDGGSPVGNACRGG
jgi:hypothetical protein